QSDHVTITSAPSALHRAESDLPMVTIGDGIGLQLLQVDLGGGVWVVRNVFEAGTTLPTHKHTGHVYAFTTRGRWHYLESPDAVNVAGSYLYEPAGSIHTLHVPSDERAPTDVRFVIHGANLNLNVEGDVESVLDAHTVLTYYRHLCAREHGIDDPAVIILGGDL